MEYEELGEIAYDGFCVSSAGECPSWDTLPDGEKEQWINAALRLATYFQVCKECMP